MRLLEHQAKKLLADFGLSMTQAIVIDSAEAARAHFAILGGPAVLKAQVPMGGRGKAGAVKFACTADESSMAAAALLGMEVADHRVERISIEPKIEFRKELYAGIVWDTSRKCPVALLSDAGGIEVENTSRIVKKTFDPWRGLNAFEGREMAAELGLEEKLLVAAGQFLAQLARAFLALDALTLEVNPVVETMNGTLLGLDAHVEIDDDAFWRQKDRSAFSGLTPGSAGGHSPTELEKKAEQIDSLDHRGVAGRLVEFDGNLALLIGGGGASLTVFDAIRRHGGHPANYCEVGGNPIEEKVAALTTLLLSKQGVSHLAVIMNVVNNTRADVMARGVLAGVKKAGVLPSEVITVFRIPGSWEQEARQLLAAEGVTALGREISLDEAARLAVERSRS